MNHKTYFISALFFILLASCEKKRDNYLPIMEDRVYAIEKLVCNNNNRYFNWQCSYYQNYIQKDIYTASEKNFTFFFDSDNFNRKNYAFRVLIYVNNGIRFRRTTRDFPFETSLVIPEGATVNIQTYFEQYVNGNDIIEPSGKVNCKASCE